jgi:hypothetical protein
MAKSRRRKTTTQNQTPRNPDEEDVPNIIEEPVRVIGVKPRKARKPAKAKRGRTPKRQKTR